MLQKLFGFDPAKHSVRTEITAGITTFLTMAYILAVNPGIFSALADKGMPTDAVFTATALAAIVGTGIMAIYAKKPFALAPGMGLNAFFVYTVCLTMGYTWQFALTAILIEGFLFIVLTLSNVRETIANTIPVTMKKAIAAGIGLFIAFIGLKNAGIVVHNDATLVSIGKLSEPATLLAIAGFFFMGILSALVVMTFLFIDLFDTIGTVVGVSMKSGMVDQKGNIPGLRQTLMADAVATVAGACFGTSTTTTYVESASGVAAGGRTGLTAFTVMVCFAIAIFFAPLFLAVPAVATAPALVLVGLFMMGAFVDVNFDHFSDSIPAFVTLIAMPLTYSIANGIMLGVITYVVLNAFTGKAKEIGPVMWVLAVLFVGYYFFTA